MTSAEKWVYLVICSSKRKDNKTTITDDVIGECLGLNRTTITGHVNKLVDKGYLHKDLKVKNDGGRCGIA